jgi:hypothetical protein
MTTLSHTLNTNTVKTHISIVQAAIQEHLKVDAGKQAAYHIFSVCNFLQNDQQLKGLLKKSTYEITTNLGNTEFPCIITHTLGNYSNENEAKYEAEKFLRSCQHQSEWNLLKDGKLIESDSGYTYTVRAMPTPKKGLQLTINIEGEKYSDLIDHLDNVKDKIEDNNSIGTSIFTREMNNYEFEIFGEEYDVIRDIDCLVSSDEFIIFDANGVISSNALESEINLMWIDRNTRYDSWSSYLIQAELIELEDALENDEEKYHAISSDSKTIYSGEIMDVLDSLKDENQEFSLYMELNRD